MSGCTGEAAESEPEEADDSFFFHRCCSISTVFQLLFLFTLFSLLYIGLPATSVSRPFSLLMVSVLTRLAEGELLLFLCCCRRSTGDKFDCRGSDARRSTKKKRKVKNERRCNHEKKNKRKEITAYQDGEGGSPRAGEGGMRESFFFLFEAPCVLNT